MANCWNIGLNSPQKWFIGNDIRTLLLEDSGVTEQVGENIYPLVCTEKVDGDIIVYSRDKYAKLAVKQGVYEDECNVAIVGISDSYDKAIALASKIDNCLTGFHIIDDYKYYFNLVDSTEDYQDFKYIETLIYNIK